MLCLFQIVIALDLPSLFVCCNLFVLPNLNAFGFLREKALTLKCLPLLQSLPESVEKVWFFTQKSVLVYAYLHQKDIQAIMRWKANKPSLNTSQHDVNFKLRLLSHLDWSETFPNKGVFLPWFGSFGHMWTQQPHSDAAQKDWAKIAEKRCPRLNFIWTLELLVLL